MWVGTYTGIQAFVGKAKALLKNPKMQFARLEWE